MKKTTYLILAVLTIALLTTTVLAEGTEVASGTCGENLTWTLDSEGTLTISGTGAMAMYSRVEPAPWYEMADDIKTLIVEEGVTIISATAFRDCSNLKEVMLPNTLVKIGLGAFDSCHSLVRVDIPDSVTTMESSVFSGCMRLEQVKLPAGITEIDQGMFQGCHSLKSITIPEGVTWIRKGAFWECNQLETVSFPSTLRVIDPDSFGLCYNLTEINIPDGVTQISSWAFEHCSGLVSIRIPASVTSLQENAFYDCRNLNGIWVDENNPYYSSDSFGVLYNKDKTVLLEMPGGFKGEYVIPEGVGQINVSACAGLTKITVPGSVAEPMVSNCESLVSIVYREGVEHIVRLYKCVNLGSVTIPASVTAIDEAAFNDCEYLRHVLYAGSQAQWNEIEIGEYNSNLTKATHHYNASGDEMISLEPVEGKKCHEQQILQCTICNQIIKGKNHVLGEWQVVSYPTCTQDGEDGYYCKYCDYCESEKIPAYGHSYIETVTAPTCLEKGFTTYTCKECGDTYADNFTEPKGHNYVNDVCLGCGDIREGYAPGDHDHDGDVDVDDVLTLLWHVLFPNEYPLN